MLEIKVSIVGLEQLTEAITFMASALAHANGMKNTVKALEEIKTEKTEPAKEETKTEKTEPAKEETKTNEEYTLEQVRSAFISKNKPSQRQALKDILNKYEAENISSLKPEHYSDVMKDLSEI